MTDLIHRPRRLRKSAALRAMFEETTLSLNDLVLPIFVEEELDDYKAIDAMPGVMRIPEKQLAREIERIANAGIRSVMTFGISHHTDDTGSDAWKEDGLVARMSRICKQTVPEMIVMSDTCFCEYTSHGHCGVLCEHGVDNDATLANLGKQAVVAAAAGGRFYCALCGNGWTSPGHPPGAGRRRFYRHGNNVLLNQVRLFFLRSLP
ncbi:delta-aminolevulinic acid dehydratase [Salmonella enterica subsp. arizonae]|uniref:Delta-aminolevulinic acid dehydratase n=1 Tax=Salmonella enterica subsp. arizonae TaxID=59203 RepID=A0A379TGB2_SALER|nr:delta-aminolevulinic acid dehydratase [Salmonella enterica subsp. arizonae]